MRGICKVTDFEKQKKHQPPKTPPLPRPLPPSPNHPSCGAYHEPEHGLGLDVAAQKVGVALQHGPIDLQLKVHQEAEADFEPAQLQVVEAADLGEPDVPVAQVFERLGCDP